MFRRSFINRLIKKITGTMKEYMFMDKTYIYINKKKARCKTNFPFQNWWSLTDGQVYIMYLETATKESL